MQRFWMRAIAIGLGALLVGACGGGSDGEESDEESPKAGAEASNPSKEDDEASDLEAASIDPCALVTAAQVRETLGEPGLSEGEVRSYPEGKLCHRADGVRSGQIGVLTAQDDSWKTTSTPTCTAEDIEFEGLEGAVISCPSGTFNVLFKTRGVVFGGASVTSGGAPGLAQLETEARALAALVLESVQDL